MTSSATNSRPKPAPANGYDPGTSLQSLVTFKNSQGIEARGTLLKLSRSTIVFEVYNPYSIVQLSEVLRELRIRRGERVIYAGRAVVNNLVNTGLMLIVSVSLIDAWNDLAGLLATKTNLSTEVQRFITDWEDAHKLRPGYQLVVSEIRSFLAELSRWLEQVDTDLHQETLEPKPRHELDLIAQLAEPILPRMSELFHRFEYEASQVPDGEVIAHHLYVQRDLHPYMMRSPFVHRAYTKPLGYAGDYEMVNMMLRDPREGPTVYSKLINALYLGQGPARAHRNRIDILVENLTEVINRSNQESRPIRFLNIGCGPAVELQRLLRSEPNIDKCHFRLLDFNKETLGYAETQLNNNAPPAAGRRPTIEFVHESVHSLLRQASKVNPQASTATYDVVYCAGLFDYLSDKVCTRLIRLFTEWTRPGGLVLATNVHPRNPERHWMEHLLEWHLIYRDEPQMLALAPAGSQPRIFTDETGINVFLQIRKPREQ